MAREPVWLDRAVLEAVHFDQLREHGGLRGLRDENALEAALARPRQRWHYRPRSDLATLAAACGLGLVKAHPWCDGNKRVAFLAMVVFLALNGRDLEAPEAEVVTVMIATAAGRLAEDKLATWVRAHLVRAGRP